MPEFERIVRLMWAPRSLLDAAWNVRTTTAIVAGVIGWWANAALMISGFYFSMGKWATALAWLSVIIVLALGFVGLLALYSDRDFTTARQRVRLRVLLLQPYCIVLPMLAWAACATWAVRGKMIVNGGPLWEESPLAVIAASSIWPGVFLLVIALIPCFAWTRLGQSDRQPRCRECGYLLIGLPERRCPECGREF